MIAKSGHTDPDPWSILDHVTGDRKFKEKLEYTGIWWLPDKPEEKLCGAIRFTPDIGAELRLIDRFKDDVEKIIIGNLSNGEYVTLYGHNRCEGAGTDISSGFQQYRCHADMIIVGHHFQKPEHIKFKSIRIRYSHLDEWVNISGFDLRDFYNTMEPVIKYRRPASIQATIDSGYEVRIDFQGSANPPHSDPPYSTKEASIKQTTYIEIEASEETSFEEYMKVMRRIQHFLSLGVMTPVYPLTIDGVIKTNEKDKVSRLSVEIYHYALPNIPKIPKLSWFDVLFTFSDISDRFDTFLKNWFKVADSLEPTVNLYFATLYTPRMYLEFHFLSLMQAIESFHRRISKEGYMSDESYKGTRDVLVNAIPNEVGNYHKQSLESRIQYGNEFSLRTRLKKFFEKYKENLTEFVENENAFVNEVVDTRNYLTHYEKDPIKHVASGEDLSKLTKKLRILLEICLLRELGFSSDEIKDMSSRNQRYQIESIQ